MQMEGLAVLLILLNISIIVPLAKYTKKEVSGTVVIGRECNWATFRPFLTTEKKSDLSHQKISNHDLESAL